MAAALRQKAARKKARDVLAATFGAAPGLWYTPEGAAPSYTEPNPITVRMWRVGPGTLDSDGPDDALKACRDGVADWLGLDDRNVGVEWPRGMQEKTAPRSPWRVRIEVEDRTPGADRRVVLASEPTPQKARKAPKRGKATPREALVQLTIGDDELSPRVLVPCDRASCFAALGRPCIEDGGDMIHGVHVERARAAGVLIARERGRVAAPSAHVVGTKSRRIVETKAHTSQHAHGLAHGRSTQFAGSDKAVLGAGQQDRRVLDLERGEGFTRVRPTVPLQQWEAPYRGLSSMGLGGARGADTSGDACAPRVRQPELRAAGTGAPAPRDSIGEHGGSVGKGPDVARLGCEDQRRGRESDLPVDRERRSAGGAVRCQGTTDIQHQTRVGANAGDWRYQAQARLPIDCCWVALPWKQTQRGSLDLIKERRVDGLAPPMAVTYRVPEEHRATWGKTVTLYRQARTAAGLGIITVYALKGR